MSSELLEDAQDAGSPTPAEVPLENRGLPTELLSKIMWFAIQSNRDRIFDITPTQTLAPELPKLRQICQNWKEIVDGEWKLWTVISNISANKPVSDLVLRNAASNPNAKWEIFLDCQSFGIWFPKLTGYIDRWKTLGLRLNDQLFDQFRDLTNVQISNARFLTSVVVSSSDYPTDHWDNNYEMMVGHSQYKVNLLAEFLSDNFPTVVHLQWEIPYLKITHVPWARLTHLNLDHSSITFVQAVQILYRFRDNAISLSLRVRSGDPLEWDRGDMIPQFGVPIFQFSNLLNLRLLLGREDTKILHAIQAPQLQVFEVIFVHCGTPDQSITPSWSFDIITELLEKTTSGRLLSVKVYDPFLKQWWYSPNLDFADDEAVANFFECCLRQCVREFQFLLGQKKAIIDVQVEAFDKRLGSLLKEYGSRFEYFEDPINNIVNFKVPRIKKLCKKASGIVTVLMYWGLGPSDLMSVGALDTEDLIHDTHGDRPESLNLIPEVSDFKWDTYINQDGGCVRWTSDVEISKRFQHEATSLGGGTVQAQV